MEESLQYEHVAKINAQINSLKYDLGRVQTPSLKKQIENEIYQKENHLNLFLKKTTSKIHRQPYNTQPLSKNERPDPLRKSNRACQAVIQTRRP
jgi:hypothetical protein